MSELTIVNKTISLETNKNPIVFISDLHFDFTKRKYRTKAAMQMKGEFIAFIKETYADSILCLAGDFFNDYRKTLQFIKELEQNRIVGFFVLGNHDFWNNGTKSYMDIISLFDAETQGNQYFRYLVTGRKYYLNDLCFIGDTGWTSFRRGKRRVTLRQFMGLPDVKKVKDFSPKKICDMHEEWVAYANGVIDEEEKVLVLTHFPMVSFALSDKDCWWSSQTNLKGENSWRIFGHTHNNKAHRYNNASSQRGYDNRDSADLERIGFKQYISNDFGKLEEALDRSSLVASYNYMVVSKFYSSALVANTGDLALVSVVKRRGYRRCSANKINFSVLANSPVAYLEQVKKVMDGYLGSTYIGYILAGRIPKSTVESIVSSIAILESGNYTDIRAFITAAVITGYVFNEMPYLIERMRPLDDYDIIRFWLMFQTMKRYNIAMDSINTVRSDSKIYISFFNVDIYLPAVNGLTLTVDEVQKQMKKTPLLPHPVALLE